MSDAEADPKPQDAAPDELRVSLRTADEVTAAEYERALSLLGIAPDADVDEAGRRLQWPGLDKAEAFLQLALHDPETVNLRTGYTRTGAEDVLGMIAGFFLTESLTGWTKCERELQKLQTPPA